MRERAAEPVALALEREVGVRDPFSASAATIDSAWDGGTTLSSRPWRIRTGHEIRSGKWLGERSR